MVAKRRFAATIGRDVTMRGIQALTTIPDPRRRCGRLSPRVSLLAIVLRAAMHPPDPRKRGTERDWGVRGMWRWARARQDDLLTHPPLGVRAVRRIPRLATFWFAVSTTPAGDLERALAPLLLAERDLESDGTRRRGSTRDAADALRVATLAGVTMGQVWAQRAAPDGDEGAAALVRLEAFPLEGAVISADAGLRRPPFVQKVVEKRGLHRAHHAQSARPPAGHRAPDRDAGHAGAGWRADGHTPRTGRAPGAGDGAVRRPQPVSGTSVRLARRAVVWLDRTDALARRTGSNALPRLDCRRCLSLALDLRRRARPAAGPLDD